jgi:hypothetical protein
MGLDKKIYRKLCNLVIDDMLDTDYHQSGGAIVYIDIEQDHVNLNNGTVLN